MKLKFPRINANQVALLRVDSLTGILLDDNFRLFISEEQIAYSIFESYKDAMNYVESVIKPKETIDATLYDYSNNIIYYYNPFDKK